MNKTRMKKTATLLIAIFMISAFAVAIPLTLANGPRPNPTTVSLSFTEYAASIILGDGPPSTGWTDNYPSEGVPYIEFIKTGKAYHRADGMWFNIWLEQMSITGNSPLTISNGRFACWTEYISPTSQLLIMDYFRGQITIYYDPIYEGWTMKGEYTQYSYFFGTAEEISVKYPYAVRVGDSDKWLLRTVVYEVTPYFP